MHDICNDESRRGVHAAVAVDQDLAPLDVDGVVDELVHFAVQRQDVAKLEIIHDVDFQVSKSASSSLQVDLV